MGRKCLACLIINNAFDILLFMNFRWFFQESDSSIWMPRNLVLCSSKSLPIWDMGVSFIITVLPVKSHFLLSPCITINLVFWAFSDNLLAQNQSYRLFISTFAFSNNVCMSGCDKYSDVSSANESIFACVDCEMSFT